MKCRQLIIIILAAATLFIAVLSFHIFSTKNRFALVDQQIESDVKNGFPGAVLLIYKDGKIIKRSAYGYQVRYDKNGAPLANPIVMTPETLFDLASNTKMYATNFAIMHLVYQKKLNVNKPLHYYLPEYKGCDKRSQCREDRLVKDFLMHSAGYMPTPEFYNPAHIKIYGSGLYSKNRKSTINVLLTRLPFIRPRGGQPVYSDADFMLLGILIERITGQRLDDYLEKEIYAPLHLKNTQFNPDKNASCAATELAGNTRDRTVDYPSIRKETVRCEVQDENTYYSMGGIAGHAGLFSNVDDMSILLQVLLNNGSYGNLVLWNKEVEDLFTTPNIYDDSYALGWRRSGVNHYFAFGDYASPDTIGHTGFTGTLTVIDRKNQFFYVLLTNKVHTHYKDGHFIGNNYATGHYQKISNLIYEALGIKQ